MRLSVPVAGPGLGPACTPDARTPHHVLSANHIVRIGWQPQHVALRPWQSEAVWVILTPAGILANHRKFRRIFDI